MCNTATFGKFTICFSQHAAGRAVDLGLDADRIKSIFENPVETWTTKKHAGFNVRDHEITIGLRSCRDHDVVVTVLPATEAAWERAVAQNRLGDRKYDVDRARKLVRRRWRTTPSPVRNHTLP